jgi:hypothetical protein
MRQYILALEKAWITQDGFFQIVTTIMEMCVVDAKLACQHDLPAGHPYKHLMIREFAGCVTGDICERKHFSNSVDPGSSLPPMVIATRANESRLSDVKDPLIQISPNSASETPPNSNSESDSDWEASRNPVSHSTQTASRASCSSTELSLASSSSLLVSVPDEAPRVPEWFRRQHREILASDKKTRKRCTRKKPTNCVRKSPMYCEGCTKVKHMADKDGNVETLVVHIHFCKDEQGNKAKTRYCFYDHICKEFLESG